MKPAFFLSQDERGTWVADAPCNPRPGEGSTRDAAVAELRTMLLLEHERGLSAAKDLGFLPGFEFFVKQLREGVEALDVVDGIRASRAALEAAINRETGRAARSPAGRRWPWHRFARKPHLLTGVDHFEMTPLLKRSWILDVRSAETGLESPLLPGGGSAGLFAFDGERALCLNRRPRNLGEVLRREGEPLETIGADGLAALLAEVYGTDGIVGHRVATVTSLEEMAKMRPGETLGYKLDDGEFGRLRPLMQSPSIDRVEDGWRICFSTLGGWMHDCREVRTWDVRVSRQYAVEETHETLSKRVFSAVPSIVY